MTALALFEGRRLSRSFLLWLGAALVLAYVWLDARSLWPVVPVDAERFYRGAPVLAGFAGLVGGWLGLRDRRTGMESLVRSTPAGARATVVPARLLALCALSLLTTAVAFFATAVMSSARGGHGWPDLRLLVDASLFVAGGACVGFAIGYFTGSRAFALLAAPALPATNVFLVGGFGLLAWVLPNTRVPERFGPLGYLPDVLTIHAVYVGGLLLVAIGGMWLLSARREMTSRAAVRGAIALLVGCALVIPSGVWLWDQPAAVAVIGPRPEQWVPLDHIDASYRRASRLARQTGPYPDDGSASDCQTVDGIRACVFPEYGLEFARGLATAVAQFGSLTELPGFPSRIRMVPSSSFGLNGCQADEYLLQPHSYMSEWEFRNAAYEVSHCALYRSSGVKGHVHRNRDRARRAVSAWVDRRVFPTSGDMAICCGSLGRVERALDELDGETLAQRLRPVWDDLRSGRLTLKELERAISSQ